MRFLDKMFEELAPPNAEYKSVSLRIDEDLLDWIDTEAARRKITRTAVIVACARAVKTQREDVERRKRTKSNK